VIAAFYHARYHPAATASLPLGAQDLRVSPGYALPIKRKIDGDERKPLLKVHLS